MSKIIGKLTQRVPLAWLRSMAEKRPGPLPRRPGSEKTLVIVLFNNSLGWVLERISRDIERVARQEFGFQKVIWHSTSDAVPLGDCYYFAHYSFLPQALRRNPHLWKAKTSVFFTHAREDLGISQQDLILALSSSSRIVTNSSIWTQYLINEGVPASLVRTFPAGAEPEAFQPDPAVKRTKIGFCSAYYPRKNPGLVLELVEGMPDVQFELIGKGWEEFPGFDRLLACKNFTYIQTNYARYAPIYNEWKVYVQASSLEGGCIPTFETMLMNVIPVASKTGAAPDIIHHGKNGYLFETTATGQEVIPLIRQALSATMEPRQTMTQYTWTAFAREVLDL